MTELVLLGTERPADDGPVAEPPRPRRGAAPQRSTALRDPRYGSRRWQRVRLRVLRRDNWMCRIAPGCPEKATVADHILPVTPGMSDELFFGEGNLRAACKRHNTARGVAARLEREASPKPSAVVTADYSREADDGAA